MTYATLDTNNACNNVIECEQDFADAVGAILIHGTSVTFGDIYFPDEKVFRRFEYKTNVVMKDGKPEVTVEGVMTEEIDVSQCPIYPEEEPEVVDEVVDETTEVTEE